MQKHEHDWRVVHLLEDTGAFNERVFIVVWGCPCGVFKGHSVSLTDLEKGRIVKSRPVRA